MQEIVCKASVESFLWIGLEGDIASAKGQPGTVIPVLKYLVNFLAVVTCNILDISDILQSSFNLERTDTGINEFFKILTSVHVLEREQMLILNDFISIGIFHVKRQTAELGTFASVGTPPETIL